MVGRKSVSSGRSRTCRFVRREIGKGTEDVSPQAEKRFRSIFDDYFEEMRGYCLRRLPVADANDAVAEVFMVAWRRIGEVPPDDRARVWLFAVARNVVRNRARTNRRAGRLQGKLASLGPEHAAGPETQLLATAAQAEIAAALDRLRPADREVIRLRLWDELSVAETAAVLRTSEKAASKRYSRALQKVERVLAMPAPDRVSPHMTPRGGEQ